MEPITQQFMNALFDIETLYAQSKSIDSTAKKINDYQMASLHFKKAMLALSTIKTQIKNLDTLINHEPKHESVKHNINLNTLRDYVDILSCQTTVEEAMMIVQDIVNLYHSTLAPSQMIEHYS